MSKISAIIFDLGGVIFMEGTYAAASKLSSVTGVTPEELLSFIGEDTEIGKNYRLGKISSQTFWYKVKSGLGIQNDWRQLDYVWVMTHSLSREMADLLPLVKARGLKIGVLSNAPPNRIFYFKSNYQNEIFKYVDAAVFSCEDNVLKPDPAAFKLIAKRLNTPAGHCLYTDDKIKHAEAAAKFGFKSIHFETPGQFMEELAKFGFKL